MKKSLAKSTLHSIHVYAAMLPFEANVTDIQVMGRLQYLLIAFQMYGCNILALAKIQAKVMESSDIIYNLISPLTRLTMTKSSVHIDSSIKTFNFFKFGNIYFLLESGSIKQIFQSQILKSKANALCYFKLDKPNTRYR